VVDDEPLPPRQLQPNVPRDLETICLKCLEKQAGKRYASAKSLAEDLHRFLAGETIHARPSGPGERLVKWVRRRPTLASLITTCVVAAAALVGIGVWSYRALALAADRAEKALEQSNKRLIHNYVDTGIHIADEGDFIHALPWISEALHLERQDPQRELYGRM